MPVKVTGGVGKNHHFAILVVNIAPDRCHGE